ncbi:cytidyltransferase [Sporosarcina sp. ACRSM]|uniref:cytidyltransferase n=1 Tax=Sporosarcina sp. ACRSM TaxID=2918216 RepID=UPI001EF65153|nr:cytidyltransferase [Sporosarcina sp. ACRSM]MCG7335775.1 cytidyltransferase [Sporosarcina sp. ACRSM]
MEIIHIKQGVSSEVVAEMKSCVLALGFFDGVHLGHQGILQQAKEIAEKEQCTFGVMTFYPHPKDILFPDQGPMTYLTPLPLKTERFESLGVEKLFIVEFTQDFARLSPEDFVESYISKLKCVHVVAGFDYHYGSKGAGSMETLYEHGGGRFAVTKVQKIDFECEKISSTAIRQLLAEGSVDEVPAYLGDFYKVKGEVKQNAFFYNNDQFVKVNVDPLYRLPRLGTYRVEVEIDGQVYAGTCHQMTWSDQGSTLLIRIHHCSPNTLQKSIEIHWIDFLYGKQNEAYGIYEYAYPEERAI